MVKYRVIWHNVWRSLLLLGLPFVVMLALLAAHTSSGSGTTTGGDQASVAAAPSAADCPYLVTLPGTSYSVDIVYHLHGTSCDDEDKFLMSHTQGKSFTSISLTPAEQQNIACTVPLRNRPGDTVDVIAGSFSEAACAAAGQNGMP